MVIQPIATVMTPLKTVKNNDIDSISMPICSLDISAFGMISGNNRITADKKSGTRTPAAITRGSIFSMRHSRPAG
jgi:hypothetical protein